MGCFTSSASKASAPRPAGAQQSPAPKPPGAQQAPAPNPPGAQQEQNQSQATQTTTQSEAKPNWFAQKAMNVTQAATGQTPQQLADSAKKTFDSAKIQFVNQMDEALANSNNAKINSILDSAMAGSALGKSAPESMKRAASQVASRQLKEAIASENPKQLKGALVAARRLNATSVPEFDLAVAKYKAVKKLPAGWDVKKMVLQRQGDKMVAKMDVSDPAVRAKFQRLIDLTQRNIYTRDRLGQPVPEKLELVSVTTIANDELWGDYMARREGIRREIEADRDGFNEYIVDTAAPGTSAKTENQDDLSAQSISESLSADFAEPLLKDANEVFLFHGTTEWAASKITTDDFKVNLAGSNAGTLYGRGVYLAENSTKSDEYTRPGANDIRYLLLCRAVLGRVYYRDEVNVDPRQCEEACVKGKFHAVLGDRKKCRGTFREFVVFDEDQVYANYILAYRRINPSTPAPTSGPPTVPTGSTATRTFQVVCPPGATAGSTLQFSAPDGSVVQVLTPSGVAPGQAFTVQY